MPSLIKHHRSRGIVARVAVVVGVIGGLAGCSSSDDAVVVESAPSSVPLPTPQPLLPPPSSDASASDSVEPPDATTEAADSSVTENPSPVDPELLAAWQANLAYERDLRASRALVDLFFAEDGTLQTSDSILTGVRDYAGQDLALLQLIDAVEVEVAGQLGDSGVVVGTLANSIFVNDNGRPFSSATVPPPADVQRMVTEGNARLDPLKPSFFPLVRATVALGAGQVNVPAGTQARVLVGELAAEVEAVYGPSLLGPLAELDQAIPAGAAFDSPDARLAFGRFARQFTRQIASLGLGEEPLETDD